MENLTPINTNTFRLNEADLRCFAMITRLRCLSVMQAWYFFYKPRGMTKDHFINNHVNNLVGQKYVRLIKTNGFNAIFILQKGIQIVQNQYKISKFSMNDSREKLIQTLPTESQLSLNEKLIPHQIYLNQFVLNFRIMANQQGLLNEFTYLNEKQVSSYQSIRPDGVYRMQRYNVDFLLEMDMGTESPRQLLDKWARYSLFTQRSQFKNSNRKIIVLFILHGDDIHQLSKRTEVTINTISKTFTDLFENNFEIYVGSIKQLIATVFKKVLPDVLSQKTPIDAVMDTLLSKKYGYSIASGYKVQEKLNGMMYKYFIRQIKDKRIVQVKGVNQEFLFDEYFYCPVSVLGRIALMHRTSSLFQINYHRAINYLVLVQDIRELYNHLKVANLLDTSRVYFTTIDRLRKSTQLHEALFTIDGDGFLYKILDATYTQKEREVHIDDLYVKQI